MDFGVSIAVRIINGMGGDLSADRSGDWALMSKKSGLTREQTRAEESNLGSIRQIVSEFTEFEKERTRLGKN